MDAQRTHWDPFGRVISPQVHKVASPAFPIRVPPALMSGLMMACAVSSLPMLVLAFMQSPLMWWGAGVFSVLLALVLGLSVLDKSDQRRFYRYMGLAEKLGWSFRLAPKFVAGAPGLSGSRRRRKAGLDVPRDAMPGFMVDALNKAEAAQREAGTVSDTDMSELQKVYEAIPELFRPRPGQPIAMTVEAEFWGTTTNGLPFWMGVRQVDMDTTFASPEIRKDLHGNAGKQGALQFMVAGYGLDRDTGIRAALTAEMLGDSRRDFKTESTEFNTRFHIAVRGQEGDPPEIEMRVLQALTPATQTSLLDLWDRYRLQIILDGATAYVSGHERVNSRDEAVLDALLPQAAEAFAAAASSFKRYVE